MNTFVLILFPDHLFDAFDWIILQTVHSLKHPDQIPAAGRQWEHSKTYSAVRD